MQMLIVKAAEGLRVPREDSHRKTITDATPERVPASAYYLRRIAEGSLIEQPAKPTKAGGQ